MTSLGKALIEIQSVNRKGLDLSLQLPKEWLFLDTPLRKEVAQHVQRGSIVVRLSLLPKGESDAPLPQLPLLQSLYRSWTETARALGYNEKEAVSFEWLVSQALAQPMRLDADAERAFADEVLTGLRQALVAWVTMKETEGNYLVETLLTALSEIDVAVAEIARLVEGEPKRYLEKLQARLKDYATAPLVDEERLAREVVLFADKSDVTEEIERLRSHCAQVRTSFTSGKKQIGKEISFLVQEMARETNTCGVKVQSLPAIKLTLKIKQIIETLKEQLHNLE